MKTTDKNFQSRSIPLNIRAETVDAEKRSVEIVVTTETPVRIWDWDHGAVDEVLLMKGAQMPYTKQIPLLDSHQRYDTSTVLGSCQALRVDGDQIIGTAYFSERAGEQWELVREGHLTDFSAGYRVEAKDSVFIPDGETGKIDGRDFTGPVLVRKKWALKEVSLVPIGADEYAKARAEGFKDNEEKQHTKEGKQMNEQMRAYLVEKGMKPDATEAEALDFLKDLEVGRREEKPKTEPDMESERREAARAERERIDAITRASARAEALGVKPEFIRSLVESGVSEAEAKARMMEEICRITSDPEKNVSTRTEVIADERDKFRAAAGDALMIRSGRNVENAAVGADDLTGFSLRELARESLRIVGDRGRGSITDMIGRAMTTTDLPNIMANVANKSVMEGWDNADETWRAWAATGTVQDFKIHQSSRISEFPDLEETPDGVPITSGNLGDQKEQFQIATYSKNLAIGRQTIINDDLDQLTHVPSMMGEAAARKVGDVVYAVLTANANMGDGTALFASGHSNLASGGNLGAPGIATIGEAIRAMGVQKDLLGKRRLNIRPVFLIGPRSLEGATEVFLSSMAFADSNTIATDSSLAATRKNPYAGNYFTRVYDARLDDDSTTAWYLAARKGKTVKAFFLNGVEAPTVEQQAGWSVLGTEFRVFIDVGAKAMDWKGLYKNPNT